MKKEYINVDFNDLKSIKKAEKVIRNLENKNYRLLETKKIGIDKRQLIYIENWKIKKGGKIKTIYINYENEKSIKKAEKEKTKLENKGYNLLKTEQMSLNEFILYYNI